MKKTNMRYNVNHMQTPISSKLRIVSNLICEWVSSQYVEQQRLCWTQQQLIWITMVSQFKIIIVKTTYIWNYLMNFSKFKYLVNSVESGCNSYSLSTLKNLTAYLVIYQRNIILWPSHMVRLPTLAVILL